MKGEKKPAKPVNELSYRVQIATASKDIGISSRRFSEFEDVKVYRHGGLFKYTVGDEPGLDAALLLLDRVRQKGVKDAFIVIFRNGERIPESEAKRLIGR